MVDLREQIEDLWFHRSELSPEDADTRAVIDEAAGLLDTGEARVAGVVDDEVVVHEWLKHAILLLFRHARMATHELGPFVSTPSHHRRHPRSVTATSAR